MQSQSLYTIRPHKGLGRVIIGLRERTPFLPDNALHTRAYRVRRTDSLRERKEPGG